MFGLENDFFKFVRENWNCNANLVLRIKYRKSFSQFDWLQLLRWGTLFECHYCIKFPFFIGDCF